MMSKHTNYLKILSILWLVLKITENKTNFIDMSDYPNPIQLDRAINIKKENNITHIKVTAPTFPNYKKYSTDDIEDLINENLALDILPNFPELIAYNGDIYWEDISYLFLFKIIYTGNASFIFDFIVVDTPEAYEYVVNSIVQILGDV